MREQQGCSALQFRLPITSNEAMQTVTAKAILFLTSKPPVMCPMESITMQCCLSTGGQKLTVILVSVVLV